MSIAFVDNLQCLMMTFVDNLQCLMMTFVDNLQCLIMTFVDLSGYMLYIPSHPLSLSPSLCNQVFTAFCILK